MIEINNLTTNPVDEEFLKKTAKIVLGGEHLPKGRVVAEAGASSSRTTPLGGVRKSESSFGFAGTRVPEGVELSIALVGQGRIRELNKKYLGKNRATDVLAFGQNQKPRSFGARIAQSNWAAKTPLLWSEARPIKLGGKNQKLNGLGLGEVVICLREVKKNAKRFNSTSKKELARVLIHGILHLLGYDHERSEVEAEKMEEKENYYLSQVNL